MRIIKKIIFVSFICCLSAGSYAQFTVGGGLNMANMFIKDWNEEDVSKGLNPGFNTGLTYNIPLSGAISVEPGLSFGTKGLRVTEEEGDIKAVLSWVNYYMDIPIMFRFTKEINDGMKLYGAAGPYLGYGLSGKMKYKYTNGSETETEEDDISFGNDDEDDLKPLDVGLSFGGGVLVGPLKVGVSFDFGLANISNYEDDKIGNRVLKFTAAYVFGGN